MHWLTILWQKTLSKYFLCGICRGNQLEMGQIQEVEQDREETLKAEILMFPHPVLQQTGEFGKHCS